MPKSYTVDGVGVVARDVHIVGHCVNDGAIALGDGEFSVVPVLVHNSAEFDLVDFFKSGSKPHVAHFEPIVRLFELPTVDYALFENAVVV